MINTTESNIWFDIMGECPVCNQKLHLIQIERGTADIYTSIGFVIENDSGDINIELEDQIYTSYADNKIVGFKCATLRCNFIVRHPDNTVITSSYDLIKWLKENGHIYDTDLLLTLNDMDNDTIVEWLSEFDLPISHNAPTVNFQRLLNACHNNPTWARKIIFD